MFEFTRHEDGRITLRLPIPSSICSPNARRGESRAAAIRKSKAIKAHRELSNLTCISALVGKGIVNPRFSGYSLAFFWKTKAYRDDDNADASCKAYRDGIASALEMDDRNLRKCALSTHSKDASRPRVEITLHPET